MSALLLAALLCAPVSAQVFETGGAAAPAAPVSGSVGAVMGAGAAASPIMAVPGVSVLAPSLNSAVIQAFPGAAATNLPAGAVRLAPPIPALPAAAAASAAPAVAGSQGQDPSRQPSAAPSRRDMVPPMGAAGASSIKAVAADRHRAAEGDVAPQGAAARLDAAGRELSAPLDAAGGLDLISAEGAASLGRKIFDRVEDRASLADGSAGGAPGEFISDAPAPARDPLLAASNGTSAGVETLRDAVASPVPAAAATGAAFSFFRLPGSLFAPSRGSAAAAPSRGSAAAAPSATASPAAPITFERLSLELGSGLVVKVRAALGFAASPAPPASRGGKPKAARAAPGRGVPVTSTEWLERRGLLESLSASEAAASQEAAALLASVPAFSSPRAFGAGAAAAAPTRSAAPAPFSEPRTPVRVPALAWWSLAFLPAGLVLLKELL